MAWSDAARAAALLIRKNKRMQTAIKTKVRGMRDFGWKVHGTSLSTEYRSGKDKPAALIHFVNNGYPVKRMVSIRIGSRGGKRIIGNSIIK